MKTRSASAASQQLQFRRHASIGAPDAEADRRVLEACFVDAGDLLVLRSHRTIGDRPLLISKFDTDLICMVLMFRTKGAKVDLIQNPRIHGRLQPFMPVDARQ